MADAMASRSAVDWRAAVWAGIAAGIVSTVVQMLLWWLLWHALPEILYRDARLAAALVMGRGVLPPPADFDWSVMAVASAIHFVLSIAYAWVLAWVIDGRSLPVALAIGSGYGLLLFAVNMYGFTALFPWFYVARDGITLTVHGVFGATAAVCYHALSRRRRALAAAVQ